MVGFVRNNGGRTVGSFPFSVVPGTTRNVRYITDRDSRMEVLLSHSGLMPDEHFAEPAHRYQL